MAKRLEKLLNNLKSMNLAAFRISKTFATPLGQCGSIF